MKYLFNFLLIFFTGSVFSQKPATDTELFDLYKSKKYTSLELKNHTGCNNYYFYKAVFYNVCNKPDISILYLDSLNKKPVSSKIEYEYWELKNDNYVKLFDYKNAAITNKYLLENFKDRFTKDELEEGANSYRIWEILQNEPSQKLLPFSPVIMPFTRDLAGLLNLKVSVNNVEGDFVFDTGAGISCITDVQAEKMGVRILPDNNIEVAGFTGIANKVRMGIATRLEMGSIVVENALFLVFKEEALTFAGGAYKINGIIGFPIAKELGTISIGKETISFEKMLSDVPISDKNLFIELLVPILLINYNDEILPFGFDTGADRTGMSKTFYQEYRSQFKKEGKPQMFTEASAGGSAVYKGITMKKFDFKLGTENISLDNVIVNTSAFHPSGVGLYGNIGQDMLKKYSTVIISFDNNYLKLIK